MFSKVLNTPDKTSWISLFWAGSEYYPTNIIKPEKYISYDCFWLQADCIVYWIYLFFLFLFIYVFIYLFIYLLIYLFTYLFIYLYRITQKFELTHLNAKNKYSLFERTLPISIIILQWRQESHKTLWL